MYHVLLVDDEENILQILKRTIQWQDMGVDCLMTAQNGSQALEILEQTQVHLMITDIKMPGMDGIDLIRFVKEHYPYIRCILLTAYGEFEYAREAIALGVENYLLKPVAKEEIEQTVQKAIDNLYGKRQNGKSLLWENILFRWVNGMITEEELGERAAVLGLNLYLPEYCVICLMKKSKQDERDFRASCVSLLEKQVEVYPFWDEKGRYIMIIGGKKLNMDDLEKCLLSRAVQYHVESTVCIAFGTVVSDIENLPLSYRTACDCVELSNRNQSAVILRNDTKLWDIGTESFAEELRFLFFSGDDRTRENGYRHLCDKLYRRVQSNETDKELTYLLSICVKILITEFPLHEDLHSRIFGETWKFEKGQPKEEFWAEAEKILKRIQKIFIEYFSGYSPIVQLAIQYIRNSVLDGTGGSVKEFCTKNGMNPAYLGHIYKKETGIFFNDYLTRCRINRSVILLRNPNYRIKDIAEKVGFASASYYVKCFREMKGISPARYRMGIMDEKRGIDI